MHLCIKSAVCVNQDEVILTKKILPPIRVVMCISLSFLAAFHRGTSPFDCSINLPTRSSESRPRSVKLTVRLAQAISATRRTE